MKRIYCALTMIVLAGCNSSGTSTAPGTGPHSDPAKNSPRKLEVTVSKDVTVTQDKTDEFNVSITRTNIKGPVMIGMPVLPAGVTLVTQDLTIPADKSSLKVTIKAAADAKALDKQKAKVTAKAMDDKDLPEAAADFDLTVKAK